MIKTKRNCNTQNYKNRTKLLLIPTFILIVLVAMQLGCTQNSRVKNWGGTGTYNLDPGQKLEEVTWKDDNLWILTRPMTEDEVPVTWTFSEKSEFGIIQGTYYIVETR